MNDEADRFQNLRRRRKECVLQLLKLHKTAGVGHIGSSLSCLEILVDLCFGRLVGDDKLILSKGHAASAFYTVLKASDRMPEAELDSFYRDGTILAAHPPCSRAIKSIPFGTGSLGHGLGLACGLALSQRFTGRQSRVYAVLSDGDCNEGSTWEAVLFAAHQKLNNLTVIVDANGIQGIGYTRDILGLEPLAEKWRSFGFHVAEAADGNDFECLDMTFAGLRLASGPACVIARTVKGHGVSFMENSVDWHYLPMSDDQFRQALTEAGLPPQAN
jgi:transketolase